MLGRVIKTLQPSFMSSHTPLHHSQYQETTKKVKRKEKGQRNKKKFRKFTHCFNTYINSFLNLHSINSNYLVLDASYDELVAEQGFKLNSIKGIVFTLINLSSLFLFLFTIALSLSLSLMCVSLCTH
jgi:hypothetical protein